MTWGNWYIREEEDAPIWKQEEMLSQSFREGEVKKRDLDQFWEGDIMTWPNW